MIKGIDVLLDFLNMMENYYPDMMRKMIIVNGKTLYLNLKQMYACGVIVYIFFLIIILASSLFSMVNFLLYDLNLFLISYIIYISYSTSSNLSLIK